ncbi:MAG: elongation factor Tu [Planctomycetota bacterium]
MDTSKAPPPFLVLAELSLLATERGGRSHPIESPANLVLFFDGCDWPARGELTQARFLYPGESAWIRLALEDVKEASERLYPGKPFLARENGRVIAYGLIKRILGQDLAPEAEAEAEAE